MVKLRKSSNYNVIFVGRAGWNCKILEAASVREIRQHMALCHGVGPWRIVSIKVRHEPCYRWWR